MSYQSDLQAIELYFLNNQFKIIIFVLILLQLCIDVQEMITFKDVEYFYLIM